MPRDYAVLVGGDNHRRLFWKTVTPTERNRFVWWVGLRLLRGDDGHGVELAGGVLQITG
jgi:hypothetical protein